MLLPFGLDMVGSGSLQGSGLAATEVRVDTASAVSIGTSGAEIGALRLQSGGLLLPASGGLLEAGLLDLSGGTLSSSLSSSSPQIRVSDFLIVGASDLTGAPALAVSGNVRFEQAPASFGADLQLTGEGVSVSAAPGLGELRLSGVQVRGPEVRIDSALTLAPNSLTVSSGGRLALSQSSTLEVRGVVAEIDGVLAVEGGGLLALDAGSGISVRPGGELLLDGAPGRPAAIVGSGSAGFSLSIDGLIRARNFSITDPGPAGLELLSGAAVGAEPFDLRGGRLERPSSGPGSSLITSSIAGSAPIVLSYLELLDPAGTGSFNVSVLPGSRPLVLRNYEGGFSGPAFENDPQGEPGGLITWLPEERTQTVGFGLNGGPERVVASWSTVTEVDVAEFVLLRAPSAGGPFEEAMRFAPTGGGSFYQFVDRPLQAGVTYHYRLDEILTHEVARELESGSALVEAAATPANERRVGPNGAFATIGDALAAGTVPNLYLRVEPGTYPSFDLGLAGGPLGVVRLVADGGPVVIDASMSPVRVRDLPQGSSFEMRGIRIEGSPLTPSGAPLEILGCEGTVVVDDCEVDPMAAFRGGVLVRDCDQVLVQRSAVTGTPSVRLEGNVIGTPRAWISNCVLNGDFSVSANGRLSLVGFPQGSCPDPVGDPRWSCLTGESPRIELPSFVFGGEVLQFTPSGTPGVPEATFIDPVVGWLELPGTEGPLLINPLQLAMPTFLGVFDPMTGLGIEIGIPVPDPLPAPLWGHPVLLQVGQVGTSGVVRFGEARLVTLLP